MINLAGIDPTETDQAVYAELMAARVDVMVDAEAIEERGEVCTRYRGRIGKSSFRRAWRYWVVNCKIPLLEASGLYAHKAKIRAGGHCEDPDPSSQVEYFLGDTKVCVDPDGSQERELLAFIKAYGPLKSPLPIFTPNADLIGAKPFVTLYHVDTILGLCLIADTIRGLK